VQSLHGRLGSGDIWLTLDAWPLRADAAAKQFRRTSFLSECLGSVFDGQQRLPAGMSSLLLLKSLSFGLDLRWDVSEDARLLCNVRRLWFKLLLGCNYVGRQVPFATSKNARSHRNSRGMKVVAVLQSMLRSV
jgi:hypothetical protein